MAREHRTNVIQGCIDCVRAGDKSARKIQEATAMSSVPTEDRVRELLLRWDELRQQGRDLSAIELCADCPELIDELLRRRIAGVRNLEPILDVEPIHLVSTLGHGGADGSGSDRRLPDKLHAMAAYRPERFHARGGLGEVLAACQEELDRTVALKRIRPDRLHDAARQRFLREAAITARLQHPGIVPIYSLGRDEDGPFYTMPLIEGRTLRDAIDAFHSDESLGRDPGRRSLELRKLLRRIVDVCNAIDYAHSRGVLHRDIKPGNIIVGKHGETLVVDWGLAKPLGRVEPPSDAGERALMPSSAGSGAETQPGSVLGTPAYMSPEQAAGAMDQLGPRSDVYSLGATLYAILTGRAPIEGKDQVDVLDRTRRGDFSAPRALNRDVDPALNAICRKAMAARPDDRYDSARALAEDLERWMADEAISAYPDRPRAAALRWFRHRPGARAWALAAVIADVLLLLIWSGLFPLTSLFDHLASFEPHPAHVYDSVPVEIYNLNVRLKWAFRLTNYAVVAQVGGIIGGLIGLAIQLGRPRVTPAVVACGAALGTVAGAIFGPRLGLALIRWLSSF